MPASDPLRTCSQRSESGIRIRETYCAARYKTRKDSARLVKQRLPSVSAGRPQLLRTNIRHAVAAYGLMVTVQSELRRSAVRNAARKTARVISAALCTPPNGPAVPLCSPSQPFRGMRAKCLRNAPEEERLANPPYRCHSPREKLVVRPRVVRLLYLRGQISARVERSAIGRGKPERREGTRNVLEKSIYIMYTI